MNSYKSLKTTFIFLSILFFNQLSAQSNWTYGIGMATNVSSFQPISLDALGVSENLEFDNLVGFSLFTRLTYKANHRFKLQSGTGISFKGAKVQDVGFETVSFNLPLIVSTRTWNELYMDVGLQYDYLANFATSFEDQRTHINERIDNRNLFSLHLGGHYNIKDWVEIGLAYKPTINSSASLPFTTLTGEPVGTGNIFQKNLQFSIVISH